MLQAEYLRGVYIIMNIPIVLTAFGTTAKAFETYGIMDEIFQKEQTVLVTVNDTKVIEPEDIIDEIERSVERAQ